LSLILGHLVSWSNSRDDVGSEEEVEATIHESRDIDYNSSNHGQGESAGTFAVTEIAKGEIDEEGHHQNLCIVSVEPLRVRHVNGEQTSERMATERK
jgi:hypothetical protein